MNGPMREINTKVPYSDSAEPWLLAFLLKKIAQREKREALKKQANIGVLRVAKAAEDTTVVAKIERGYPLGLSEGEAAQYLGVTFNLFRELVASKKLPKPKNVGGLKLYNRDALAAALQRMEDTESEEPHE